MSDQSVVVALFVFIICILAVFFCCIRIWQNYLEFESAAAYSAPVIVTSQSHQRAGSLRATTLINDSSRSPRSSSSAAGTSAPYRIKTRLKPSEPYTPKNTESPYPPQSPYNPKALHPPQPSAPQQMPHPSHLPYPPQTIYPPQDVSNITPRSNTPQPSAPSFSPGSEDMDIPPNYDEAMTILSKEQKKF